MFAVLLKVGLEQWKPDRQAGRQAGNPHNQQWKMWNVGQTCQDFSFFFSRLSSRAGTNRGQKAVRIDLVISAHVKDYVRLENCDSMPAKKVEKWALWCIMSFFPRKSCARFILDPLSIYRVSTSRNPIANVTQKLTGIFSVSLFQVVWHDGLLRGMQQGDPSLRNGHEGEGQRLPLGVLRLSTVQPQVY